MKICPVRADLFRADGWTGRWTDMMIALRKFANASKNESRKNLLLC